MRVRRGSRRESIGVPAVARFLGALLRHEVWIAFRRHEWFEALRAGEAERSLVERLVQCGQVGSVERLEAFRRNRALIVSIERRLCLKAAGWVRFQKNAGSADCPFCLNESKRLMVWGDCGYRAKPDGGVSRAAGTDGCRSARTTDDRIVIARCSGVGVLMERGLVDVAGGGSRVGDESQAR